jgi:predicted ester cyclase
MTRDDAAALFERRQEYYRQRDSTALAGLHAPDGVVHSPLFPDMKGRDAIATSYLTLFSIFPDWEISFEPAIIDGNRAAQPFVARATHAGEFMGLPGTGRRVQIHGAMICTLGEGGIVREQRVYDFTGLLIQIGVLRGKMTKAV